MLTSTPADAGETPSKVSLEGLPFVAMNGKRFPRNFWNVASTGDYGKDYALGGEYAQAALLYMVPHNEPYLLKDVVLDMIENFQHFPMEEWEKSSHVNARGIIIGFMDEMGEHARRPRTGDQLPPPHHATKATAAQPLCAKKINTALEEAKQF